MTGGEADALAFANDALNKIDVQLERTRRERDAWRAAFVKVVGAEVAEMRYRQELTQKS